MNIAGGAYCFHSQIIRRCLAGGAPQCFILHRSTASTFERLRSASLHLSPNLASSSPFLLLGITLTDSFKTYRRYFAKVFSSPDSSQRICKISRENEKISKFLRIFTFLLSSRDILIQFKERKRKKKRLRYVSDLTSYLPSLYPSFF